MTDKEAFSKHMAKVYLSQAIAFRVRSKGSSIKAKSWHSFLLCVAGRNRVEYLSYLRRDRSPLIKIGQMDLF